MEDSRDKFMRLMSEQFTPLFREDPWKRELREAFEQFKRDYPDLIPAALPAAWKREMIEFGRLAGNPADWLVRPEVARLPPEQLVTRAAPDPGTAQTETKPGALPEDKEAQLRQLWLDDGLSYDEIGKRLGYDGDHIRKKGYKLGLPKRKSGRKSGK